MIHLNIWRMICENCTKVWIDFEQVCGLLLRLCMELGVSKSGLMKHKNGQSKRGQQGMILARKSGRGHLISQS
jgi:hypothetical protein